VFWGRLQAEGRGFRRLMFLVQNDRIKGLVKNLRDLRKPVSLFPLFCCLNIFFCAGGTYAYKYEYRRQSTSSENDGHRTI
jgi:hypothetical protein